ncbi:Uncharacterized conserved protein [Klebsiella pneumoniae]|uniref:Uncharacterized conserved protein n=2 Tax=Klebsiella pneumoniae TaxID=573 RepID=A0A377Z2P9_KLEPO|nr:Uncharacterized conserved protein [Klebsiella pneumoniae]STS68089.1 Uncharacterized conserved protein [Klebsiella pneumoniae]STS72102.1 Uncharacterized conserved protein [Klebsiella pneumoniae]STU60030.1 Uncharacterized conserved protein [Klebsiella pneumoniae subsp. ozaenae]VFS28073.1 Uncharacterized conserved protein [Serratia liquefaciens]
MGEAARVGDAIGHSHALAGMIGGTIVGGLIAAAGAVAAGALFVAGLAASCVGVGVLLVGASLAVGYLTGELATKARDGIAEAGAGSLTPAGKILTGSPDVRINGKPAAIATVSQVACDQDGLVWRAPSGDYVSFPMVPCGHKTYCEAEKCWLMHNSDGSWQVFDVSEQAWHYPALSDEPGRLQMMTDLAGNAVSLFHDDHGRLTELVDSAGQRLACRYLTTANGLSRLSMVLLHTRMASCRWCTTPTMRKGNW